VNKILGSLAKRNLVARVQNAKYDGYRLTYGGYDYLAMRALSKRDSLFSVGNQIGVGKESDIYVVADAEGNQMVLKLHRLGRISFRAIKSKRDYLGKRKSASWMYMSRLSAQKEWAFMKVLHEHGFPVPKPIDQARHCILMGLIDAYPLRQINEVPSPGKLYSILMDLIVRFARAGLIHGDYNEFNILIHRETGEPVVIDFPQMVSTSHENAEWYFNRDVECIRTFFRRRFRYESALYPKFKASLNNEDVEGFKLDVEVAASGFRSRDQKVLEEYMKSVQEDEESGHGNEEESEEGEESEDGGSEDEEGSVVEDGGSGGVVDGGETKVLPPDDIEEPASQPSDEDRDEETPPRTSSPLGELADQTAKLDVGESRARGQQSTLKEIVSNDLSRNARRHSKHHSKKGARLVGRAKGSKAKQDTRVKLGSGKFWD